MSHHLAEVAERPTTTDRVSRAIRRFSVPIAFFWTGLHGDYHQNTDEPQFIDYPHYASIANYIRELTVDVANGPRPRLNGTKPARPRNITP